MNSTSLIFLFDDEGDIIGSVFDDELNNNLTFPQLGGGGKATIEDIQTSRTLSSDYHESNFETTTQHDQVVVENSNNEETYGWFVDIETEMEQDVNSNQWWTRKVATRLNPRFDSCTSDKHEISNYVAMAFNRHSHYQEDEDWALAADIVDEVLSGESSFPSSRSQGITEPGLMLETFIQRC